MVTKASQVLLETFCMAFKQFARKHKPYSPLLHQISSSKLCLSPNMASKMAPISLQQMIKGDRSMITMSDDNAMMKQIHATHAHDGRQIDVRPLYQLVEDILNRSTPGVDAIVTIACKCSGGGDAHATTLSIFNMLASYSWDAKLVLTLAAFALNYGEFWLLAQIYSSNQLAKSVAILKQVPILLEHSALLKPRFDALNNLIRAMMDVTRCIIEFKELPPMSIVACATQIASLTSMGHEYAISTTNETWELSTLAHKINSILDHLKKQLFICYQYIEEKRNVETYQMLQNLFQSIHIDNMKILKALIYAKDDMQPLVDGSTKRRVHIDVLRRKNVLLLISDLDISQDELSILEQIYNESRVHATRMESQYEATMPWFSVHSPTLIDKAVIRFIKEVWHFRNKPILVVLDPQGKVVSPNAIHMMWIWGSNAFPFTSLREEALWKEETWKLELLVDGIDPTILNWIKEGKFIYLYGGTDMEWIRKFTTTAKAVASAARIPLEMVHCWQDLTMVWFFWTRLESMLFSKIQLGQADDQDPMMHEIKKLLSYDKEGGWAVLSKGSFTFVNGHGTTILPTLLAYEEWQEHVVTKGFDIACMDYHSKVHSDSRPCCRFEFLSTSGRIPDKMKMPRVHPQHGEVHHFPVLPRRP
ncbi:Protein SIEVE ELEMENT OCCLUSION B [Vitis vinifera]|uniref:Protein SIEVE ELEMENT OCCLUSION B n=1 Tax=Vitis vinifera TaxID=29760 RepID=A0A438CBP8_VITVI|nr:Protein SIEVE ELEMENT OCCLUSION B [Vitis vinifera]